MACVVREDVESGQVRKDMNQNGHVKAGLLDQSQQGQGNQDKASHSEFGQENGAYTVTINGGITEEIT